MGSVRFTSSSFLAAYILILAAISFGVTVVSAEFSYGACESENATCAECYRKLKESLLGRDQNVRNLSVAFFPPKANIPEFVRVTYCFGENCNQTKIWYWTHDSSYLFFPIETFQFLSLLFGKLASRFSQPLTLTLDEECYGLSQENEKMFTLLTQRLKDFIKRASIEPEIDENYFARAEEKDKEFLTSSIARYILSFYIVGLIVVVVITVMLIAIKCNRRKWDDKLKEKADTSKKNKYMKSRLFGVCITAFIFSVFALVMDILAVVVRENNKETIDEHYVHALPIFALCIDMAAVGFGLTCWLFSAYSHFAGNLKHTLNWEYLALALSAMGPIMSLVIHLPYIAIAYLNDAAYATSIFIYYTVIAFSLFGGLELTFGTCQGAIIDARNKKRTANQNGANTNTTAEDTPLLQGAHAQGQNDVTPWDCIKYNFKCCPGNEGGKTRWAYFSVIFIFMVSIFVLIGLTIAALLLIPISKAFSDVSDRLLGFYQTAFIFVGAYVFYWQVFRRKPSLHRAIKDREEVIRAKGVETDDEWNGLSKYEKIEAFYSKCVDIVAQFGEQQN